MHYLAGLFLSLASVPGYTSASIPAGWAAMSIFLPLATWREARLTSLHFLLLAFLVYAALSISWTIIAWDGGFRLWQLTLIALAFYYGSSLPDLRQFVLGLACGCAVSSALSVAQWYGFQPVPHFATAAPAGLFYNPVFLGMTLSLVAIACLCLGLWPMIPLLLPGIYLSQSRGAWLSLGLGAIAWVMPSRWLPVLAIAFTLFAITIAPGDNDIERMAIWVSALAHLTPFGNGAGSFSNLLLLTGDSILQLDSAHNDALQLLFEFGIGTVPFLAIIACCLWRSHHSLWPVLASFTFLSFFSLPLFSPITACLFSICAGRIASDWDRVRRSLADRRRDWLLRYASERLRQSFTRRKTLPLQPGT